MPLLLSTLFSSQGVEIVGVDNGEGPPVPIPNTEVKLTCAENTWLETAWENRYMPTLPAKLYCFAGRPVDYFIFLLSSVGRACGC